MKMEAMIKLIELKKKSLMEQGENAVKQVNMLDRNRAILMNSIIRIKGAVDELDSLLKELKKDDEKTKDKGHDNKRK